MAGNINTDDKAPLNLENCIIYSLKDSWKEVAPADKCILKVIGNLKLEIDTGKDKTKRILQFRFMKEKSNLLSPKIILYPQAQIGLLMFSIELIGENQTIDDLTTLNYCLHKTDKGQSPVIQISAENKGALPEEKINEINNIYTALAKYTTFDKSKKDKGGWYLNGLVNFLLSDLKTNPITLFNEDRAHLLTYLSVEASQFDEKLINDYIRIIHCRNEKYQVMKEELDLGKYYAQTFENIYIGSSVEGAAIMTLATDDAPEFIKNFKTGSLLTRYLWIYLLVYLQRHTLIELTKELMDIDMEVAFDSKNNLGQILSKLSIMKIKSYFTEISDYTQHNSFYRFCANKLSIRQYFDEIREKVNDLTVILQEKELQQEKEIQRLEEQYFIEMTKQKEQELMQIKETEKKEEQRNQKLSLLLGLIAIAQLFFAFVAFLKSNIVYEWISSYYSGWHPSFDIITTVLAICAIIFSCFVVYKAFRKK
jgi:hypothetical protein